LAFGGGGEKLKGDEHRLKKESRKKYCSVDRETVVLAQSPLICHLLVCTLNIEVHSVSETNTMIKKNRRENGVTSANPSRLLLAD
jgi:hypothetical protein